MSDLISRSALLGYIEEQIEDNKEERSAVEKRKEASSIYFYSGEISALKRIKRNINMFAPAVDAVPVVRCRDCQEIEPCVAVNDWYAWCNRWGTVVSLDGFCHKGAKADGGDAHGQQDDRT